MLLALAVAAVAGVGAACRYVADQVISHRHHSVLPWGTITINVVGSFVLGLTTGLASHHGLSMTAATIIGSGFCAGFTTFSTWMWETIALSRRCSGEAAINVWPPRGRARRRSTRSLDRLVDVAWLSLSTKTASAGTAARTAARWATDSCAKANRVDAREPSASPAAASSGLGNRTTATRRSAGSGSRRRAGLDELLHEPAVRREMQRCRSRRS